ncbi:MAG: toprim domain-containing protein [Methylobacter sp.]|nr:toprim domain-containing protein [Methylobacter sp.]
MSQQSIEDACRTACEAIGVIFKNVEADGLFHVADLADDHKGKNDARIKIFQDSQGGIVWNHKSGQRESFFVNDSRGGSGEPLPQAERERIQREQQQRQAEQQRKQDKAAGKAQAIWQAAKPAPPDHPYLVRKQIKPHGLRIGHWERSIQDDQGKFHKLIIDDVLLAPMFDSAGSLRSLQAIFKETHSELSRDKDFLPGAGIAGLFGWIGAKTEKVLIAEGFATAATLHEESGYRVYIAFTANNLMAVGGIVREKLPDAETIFCADNDIQTPGNPGLTKATEAAQAVGGSVTVPPIHGDFNDYAIYLKGLNHDEER